MDKLYIIKIGKMYVRSYYIDTDAIETNFICEVNFTFDKDKAYTKLNEKDANILIEKLYKIFNILIEDFIELEEVEDEQ